MKKRLIALLLVIVLTAGVVSAGFTYFGFVDRTIFEESTAHLTVKSFIRQIKHSQIWFLLTGAVCECGRPTWRMLKAKRILGLM